MGRDRFILMADIVGSRKQDQKRLLSDFKRVVQSINIAHRKDLVSPLTITLGDEFQGVAKDLSSSIRILFALEEEIVRAGRNFKLRHVLDEGAIETPINRESAHAMMGPGLTQARELLEGSKKNGSRRFIINLKDARTGGKRDLAFGIYSSFIDDWNTTRDFPIVSEFLRRDDYKEVASALGKDRSLIWKRERSLKVKEYKAIKALIEGIAKEYK
jgi:hypothetical protein